MEQPLKRIPVTILTGFLGAGKTTLLRNLLTEPHGRRIAVIENEFANLDIDSSLVRSRSEETIELKNGCICCSIQDELMHTLISLAGRREKFDELVIETTGVANPSSLVQAFLSDPFIRVLFHLNAVVTLVDSKHFPLHVNASSDFREQIAFADLLVLNKADLVSEDEIAAVETQARAINRSAEFLRTAQGQVSAGRIFSRFDYDSDRLRPETLDRGSKQSDLPSLVSSLSLEITGEIEEEKLMEWIRPFIAKYHHSMFRTKGIFSFAGHKEHVVVQGVHATFGAGAAEDGLMEPGKSKVVFIGRELPRDEILRGIGAAIVAKAPAAFSFVPGAVERPSISAPSSTDWRIKIV